MRIAAALYVGAGITTCFAHVLFISSVRDLPPIASLFAGAVWPIVGFIWGLEVLF